MASAPPASPAPPQVLLVHHLRQLKLPTFLREYEKVATETAREGLDHVRFLLRLAELELIDLERARCEYVVARDNVSCGQQWHRQGPCQSGARPRRLSARLLGRLLHRGQPRPSIDGGARRAAFAQAPNSARPRQAPHHR